MEQVWFAAALWLVLALIATLLSIWFRISTALSEIVVGTVAQLSIGALIGTEMLGAKSAWVSFPAGPGAIVLTFLAGAELDPTTFRTKVGRLLVDLYMSGHVPKIWRSGRPRTSRAFGKSA
jgi:glutathione-regulated potassium-efflux system ancillary protein KefC